MHANFVMEKFLWLKKLFREKKNTAKLRRERESREGEGEGERER